MELGNFKESNKYVGVAECQVLGVNLSREQYKEKTGRDLGYTPVYVRTAKSGCKAVNVIFYLKEITTGEVFPLTFFLEDRQALTSNGKLRYVNNKCQSAVTTPEWFLQYPNRIAYHGEAELLTFIRVFTSPELKWYGDYKDSGSFPLDETQVIFDGNFGPIGEIINRYNKWTIGALTGIRINERGEFQDVFNRAFVKGSSVATLSSLPTGTKPETQEPDIREFLKTNEGPLYYKHFYGNSYQFRKYVKDENIIASTNSAVITPDNENMDELPF